MEFVQFKEALQAHVAEMLKDTTHLFQIELDKDALWNKYLDSFPPGANKIFRERREHDCSACRHFVKSFGNVAVIKDSKVITIWDFTTGDEAYQNVLDSLSSYVRGFPVTDVLVTKEATFGTDKNREETENGNIITWDHLYTKLPQSLVYKGGDTVDTVKGQFRDIRNVFKRSLDEITIDAVSTVLELIAQKSLYKGEEWEAVLKKFLALQKEYHKLPQDKQELWCWEQSVKVGPVIGKIRNHSIGTLLTDITLGTDLDVAVRSYEAIVAPGNYKRPKAIFTKKMLEDAQKKLEELGLMDSLGRRFATLDDITVPNTLFANRDAVKRMTGNVFDEMAEERGVDPKSFSRAEEVTIDTFVKDILPTAKSVEVLFENRHVPNLVSLVAPKVKGSKTLFKWNNGFSWAYSGNIADSMKERVKAAGGKVDGVLRFSIQWNDDEHNPNDFDAHCIEPSGDEIFYANKFGHRSTGTLDVDIIHPVENTPAVENITWSDQGRMPEGKYTFFVHCYNQRGGRQGFSAEIEFDGQVFQFSYDRELRQGEKIPVATVLYSRKDGFKVIEALASTTSSRKVWGLDTNKFYPVQIALFSPNYWDLQEGIGHRHYFFMLKGCVNDEAPNGFFNEYLREDLLAQKRVFEALGAKMRVEDAEDQLSGIGFSSTKPNSLIVKVEGQTARTLKITF